MAGVLDATRERRRDLWARAVGEVSTRPACTRPTAWTSLHHLAWWTRDHGPTNLANGIALCHHCHRLVHDHAWTVTLDPDTATATWTSPAGGTTISRPHAPADTTTDRDEGHRRR